MAVLLGGSGADPAERSEVLLRGLRRGGVDRGERQVDVDGAGEVDAGLGLGDEQDVRVRLDRDVPPLRVRGGEVRPDGAPIIWLRDGPFATRAFVPPPGPSVVIQITDQDHERESHKFDVLINSLPGQMLSGGYTVVRDRSVLAEFLQRWIDDIDHLNPRFEHAWLRSQIEVEKLAREIQKVIDRSGQLEEALDAVRRQRDLAEADREQLQRQLVDALHQIDELRAIVDLLNAERNKSHGGEPGVLLRFAEIARLALTNMRDGTKMALGSLTVVLATTATSGLTTHLVNEIDDADRQGAITIEICHEADPTVVLIPLPTAPHVDSAGQAATPTSPSGPPLSDVPVEFDPPLTDEEQRLAYGDDVIGPERFPFVDP